MYESANIVAPSQHQSKSSPQPQSSDKGSNQPDTRFATAFDTNTSNVVLPPPRALRVSSSRDRFQYSSRSPSPTRLTTHQRTQTEDNTPKNSLLSHLALKDQSIGLGKVEHPAIAVSTHSYSPDIRPSLSLQSLPLPFPCREEPEFYEEKPIEFERETTVEHKRGKLANWFKGESDAINIGLIPSPAKERSNPMSRPVTPRSVPQTSANTPSKRPTTMRPSAPATGLFSFLGSRVPQTISTESPCTNDELSQLDIRKALSPGGQADPFSPSSFKNLMQNAEGLLLRMQNALKQRSTALHEVTVEKEAQSDELEEAQTRARHLKLQLDDLSAKLTEQDQAMMNLVEELAHEKQAHRDDEDFRRRSIRIVDVTGKSTQPRPRVSRTSTVSHDSGFESDEDGLFPPTELVDSPTTTISTMGLRSPLSIDVLSGARPPLTTPNITKEVAIRPSYSCMNCHGIRGSEAWNVVGVLKAENEGLKHRVGELESALDGCLDMVNGLS